MDQERPLHADAVGDAPDREVLAQAATGDTNHDALENLDALARAFDHFGVHLDRVAGTQSRHLLLLLLLLELLNDVHLSPLISSVAAPSRCGAAQLVVSATA